MAKTLPATGLAITQDSWRFTFDWKQGETYRTENANWTESAIYKNGGKWNTFQLSTATQTSFQIVLNSADYYPLTTKNIEYIGFAIWGTAKDKSASAKAYGWHFVDVPNRPNIEVELGTFPSASFEWSVPDSEVRWKDYKTTAAPWYTRLHLTSVLVKDSGVTDGSQIDWNTAEAVTTEFNGTTRNSTRYDGNFTTESGNFTVVENSTKLNDGHSYTRWVRIIAQGPAGDSEIRYAKHVYAMPNQCEITNHKLTKAANGYNAQVWFNSPITTERPVDTIETEYILTTPGAGITCPSGLTWDEGTQALAVDQTGGATFTIDNQPDEDEALFIRVNSTYDERTTTGEPMAIAYGKLATPTITNVTAVESTHKVTVEATNNSDVLDSFLVVRYMTPQDPNGFDIAIIPHGQTTVTGVQCPTWTDSPRFGVYAVAPAGCYTTKSRGGGVTGYIVKPTMKSDMDTSGGAIPVAPATISATPTGTQGTVLVTWDWSWADADGAEISWADHADAWESTNEPDTYDVSKINTASWNISGLMTGVVWYIRVRLYQTTEGGRTYGAYSATVPVDLASAPKIPVLDIPVGIITEDGQIDASWVYTTSDGTPQAFAEVAEVIRSGGSTTYKTIVQTQTAQHVTISARSQSWQSGETHTLVCRVESASGIKSDGWSNEVTIAIAEPITCEITETSLETVSVPTYDEHGQTTRSVLSVTELPMTATVEGAGDYGTTTLTIERATAYHVDRPNETDFNGYAGETIYTTTQQGEAQITINREDLIGHLDDGAAYRLTATASDGLGQTASASINFEVHWSHQAEAPTATVEIDTEHRAAKLTPIAPSGAASTDVCDIYRLSADRPQLVYEGAEFGETYVDPYPAIGEHGGHRFVTRTADGDYITAENTFAWYDTGTEEGDRLDLRSNLIDFEDGQAELTYNAELSNAWKKDFRETKYLGGSVQGDWNKAVSRTASLTVTAVADKDAELIKTMRRLADNTGICHVRTKDGSSYPADVQVNETYNYAAGVKTYEFGLSITRVDPEHTEGMTLAEWQNLYEESE